MFPCIAEISRVEIQACGRRAVRAAPAVRNGRPVIKKLLLFFFVAVVFLLPAAAVTGLYFYFSHDLPRIESLRDYAPALVTQVNAGSGELLAEFAVEKRYLIGYADIAPVFIKAILAAEDDTFFEHKGIDFFGIVRAAVKNIRSGQIRQGGSTITQQIVKSLLLSSERSYTRKIKEAILATRIERYLTKQDILTLYLNQIYFGRGAYGVEAAARCYFGKSASQLILSEAAFLAGLPKAPSYSRNMDRALERWRYVLGRMQALGYISAAERRAAQESPPAFVPAPTDTSAVYKAPYFVECIRRDIEERYGVNLLYKGGLKIETTLDTRMQDAAEGAVLRGIEAYDKRRGRENEPTGVQSALLCMEPYTGHIKALVGGRDFYASQFNRAVQAQRQPGSAFKPIIYAAALDKGYTPASIFIDAPLVIEAAGPGLFWEPQNYDRTFTGPTTLRRALTLSRNIVTVKILKYIGPEYVIGYAKNLGMEGEIKPLLSLALGSCGVSLLNLVRGYSVFCAQGIAAEPTFIARILARDGTVIEDNRPRLRQAISPETAFLMASMLQSVVEEGTGKKVRALNRPCAGKTGTTNDVRDAWFIGFTPKLVAGVWLGYDDLSPLGRHETGGVAAAPVWLDFMEHALEGAPVQPFKAPDGVVFAKVNPETGLPPEPGEPWRFECFKQDAVPGEGSYRGAQDEAGAGGALPEEPLSELQPGFDADGF